MILEQLFANMRGELSNPMPTATPNEIRSLGIKHPKARKTLLRVYNEFLELNRQMRAGEAERPELNKKIDGLIDIAAAAIDADLQGLDTAAEPEDDEYTDLVVFDLEKSKELLEKYAPHKEKMQRDVLTQSHVLKYAPVLPLCKPFLEIEKLKAAGFQATRFEGYTVLEKQLVIGISHGSVKKKLATYQEIEESFNTIQSLGKKAHKTKKSSDAYLELIVELKSEAMKAALRMKSNAVVQEALAKLRTTNPVKGYSAQTEVAEHAFAISRELHAILKGYDGPLTEEALLDTLVKSASNMTKQTLMRLGSPINYLDATWLWVATAKEIGMLQRCALGGHFALQRWSFAFGN